MKVLLAILLAEVSLSLAFIPEKEKSSLYWRNQAQETLQQALKLQNLNTNIAKNTIIFLGDGMGIATVTAARILKGQLANEQGEDFQLEMDKFPFVALSKIFFERGRG